MGYEKKSIDKVLHYLVMAKIKEDKKNYGIPRIKKFRLNPLSSGALSLLKTLFIRKPKNPV